MGNSEVFVFLKDKMLYTVTHDEIYYFLALTNNTWRVNFWNQSLAINILWFVQGFSPDYYANAADQVSILHPAEENALLYIMKYLFF